MAVVTTAADTEAVDATLEPVPTSQAGMAAGPAAADTEAVDATLEPELTSQTGREEAVLTQGSLAGVSEASSHADLEDLAIAVSPQGYPVVQVVSWAREEGASSIRILA